MRAFSKKSSYVLIILMITALLHTEQCRLLLQRQRTPIQRRKAPCIRLETSQPESLAGLKATSAILIDGGSDGVHKKNAEAVKDPASITKIMTCLLTLENKDMDDEITIDFQTTTEGHNLALKQGEVLTVRDLLHALMLYSCNDAAEVLAAAVGGGRGFLFAEMMNERAKECGAKNTTFANPNGLNPEGKPHNQTTAYDIAMMAREAMKNPEFRKLVKTRSYTIPKTNMSEQRKEMKSTNACLRTYKGANGSKTGTSTTAGFCFCGSAKRGNTELIAVALDSGDKLRFSDAEAMMDYGFQTYHTYTVEKGGKELDQVRVRRGDLHVPRRWDDGRSGPDPGEKG